MENGTTIKHTLSFVLRLADGNTFQPVERAKVLCHGKDRNETEYAPMKKDGGYYVFLEGLPSNAEIIISHPDYETSTVLLSPKEERAVVYLKHNKRGRLSDMPSVVVTKDCSAGSCELSVEIMNFSKNIILDDCRLTKEKESYRIRRYEAGRGSVMLEQAMKKEIKRGTVFLVGLPDAQNACAELRLCPKEHRTTGCA